MYAIIETGGKQYRVQPDDIIEIEKLNYKQGENFNFDTVLAISNDDEFIIGTPYVENATVSAGLIENGKDDKIIVYKYKPKKKYRKKQGHRQPFSKVKINEIIFNSIKEDTLNDSSDNDNVEIEVEETETVEE